MTPVLTSPARTALLPAKDADVAATPVLTTAARTEPPWKAAEAGRSPDPALSSGTNAPAPAKLDDVPRMRATDGAIVPAPAKPGDVVPWMEKDRTGEKLADPRKAMEVGLVSPMPPTKLEAPEVTKFDAPIFAADGAKVVDPESWVNRPESRLVAGARADAPVKEADKPAVTLRRGPKAVVPERVGEVPPATRALPEAASALAPL
jgi:hypothetical protein